METRRARPRIAFCGPIAEAGRPAKGGYEAANRRTIDNLRKAGLDIIELPYADARGSAATKIRQYAGGFSGLLAALAQRRHDYDVLHLTLLYQKFIVAEAALGRLARALDKRVLIDIRAGVFQPFYSSYGPVYRTVVDRMLARADAVAIEGLEDEAFVNAQSRRAAFYFPNYVDITPIAEPTSPPTAQQPIKLVYVGRVVPEKGIETVIEVGEILAGRGVAATIDIIGAGDSGYCTSLRRRAQPLGVVWHGALAPLQVRRQLGQKHFFVFPTRHFGEGHSNALTEAMAEGVVPICSAHGFNRSVVGDGGEILEAAAPAVAYADMLMRCAEPGRWSQLSWRARERAENIFSSARVIPRLVELYEGLPSTCKS